MKRYFLPTVALISVQTVCIAQHDAQVKVDTATTYQEIYGFGGVGMNGQWSDVYTEDQVDMLWGADGMGYNIMRIRICPDESNWDSYVEPVKWAKERGATIFATPWTPPYRFKVDAEQTYGQSSNHGSINTDSIEAYAQWLEEYRQYMEDEGATLDIISIQNECDYDPDGYEGCLYSESEMAQMVTAARKYISEECLLMAPECFGWGSETYNRELVQSAAARNNIDIWGNHIYGATDLTYVNYVRNLTGNPMWMTEYIFDEDEVGTWENACSFAESIDSCMRAGFGAYVYYNMLNHFFGDGTGGGDTSKPSTFAYIMSHYAKYATGKTRIKATFTDESDAPVNGSAYMNAGGDTISVFVLNESDDSVSLQAELPFISKQVYEVVTTETRGRYEQNASDEYAGSASPAVVLMPQAFYTLLFIANEAEEGEKGTEDEEVVPADAYKTEDECNPLNPYWFCADPTAVEYDGRLYVYGTNDQQEYNITGGLISNSYGYIKSIVVMSTEDLVNWTFHGTIDMTETCGSWMYASWAPSVVSREESDGLTHFYMYFSNSAGGVGVVTATSPLGPWTDPLEESLISSDTEGLGLCSSPFDPGALIDDDGTGWLAFGGGSPNEEGTDIQPGNARIVQLGEDMISLASDIATIPAPYQFEANELNYIGGKYVYSYCTNWRDRTDWSSYSSTLDEPSTCSICYMTSDDPLDADSWTYKGEYFSNPGAYGYTYGNNHTHLQKYGSLYYLFYHTQELEEEMGVSGGYRCIGMNKCTVVERSQRISAVTAASTGVSQLTANRVDAFSLQQAEMLCTAAGVTAENTDETGNTLIDVLESGAWTMTKGVQFGSNGTKAFTAYLQGSGKLEVRLDDAAADAVASIDFSSDDVSAFTVEINDEISSVHNVFFVFSNAGSDVKFDAWQFAEAEETGITQALNAADAGIIRTEYYTLSGIRLTGKPNIGIYIRKDYYDDGTTQTEKKTAK